MSTVTPISQSVVDPSAFNVSPNAGATANSNTVTTQKSSTSSIIDRYLEQTMARITKYDLERDKLMEQLQEQPPAQPMKMSQAEWKEFLALKAENMANYNVGALDGRGSKKGHNARESNAINQIDNAFTTNGAWLTLAEAKDMFAVANANGLQKNGSTFEDGHWQAVFNSIRSFGEQPRQDYEKDVADYKKRQDNTKLALSNVTQMLTGTQTSMASTVKGVQALTAQNDMANYSYRNTQLEQLSRSQADAAQRRQNAQAEEDAELAAAEEEQAIAQANQPIRVQVKTNNNAAPFNVKVAVQWGQQQPQSEGTPVNTATVTNLAGRTPTQRLTA